MGRKRLEKPKKRVQISIDKDVHDSLKKVGVNVSRLFEISGKLYLRKLKK